MKVTSVRATFKLENFGDGEIQEVHCELHMVHAQLLGRIIQLNCTGPFVFHVFHVQDLLTSLLDYQLYHCTGLPV